MYPASRDGWADKGFCSQTLLGCTPGSWPQCQQGHIPLQSGHGVTMEDGQSSPAGRGAPPAPRSRGEQHHPESRQSSVSLPTGPLPTSHPASFPFPSSPPAPAAASQPARHIPDSSHPPGPSAGARAECAASTWREQGLIPPIPRTIKPSASAGANTPSARGAAGGEGLWWVGPCLPKAASDAWGHQLVPGERDKRGRLAGKPTAVMTAPCDCRRLLLILAP